MGTLFWQHNDCWPVASWSSRDFYGRWKAQHYFAKKAYRNILVSPIEKNGILSVYIVSDSLSDCNGKLSVSVLDFNGDTIFSETQNVTVKANASQIYFSKPTSEIIAGKKKSEIFVRAEFVPEHGGYITDNNYFLCTMKEMNFPQANVDWKSEKADGGYYVTLNSKTFVRGTYLSITGVDNAFSDNYFDILPNQPVKIFVRTNISQSDFDKQLQVHAFNVWTPIKKTLPIKETKIQIKDKAIIQKTY
jgi:beta-mannosidase